MDDILNRLEKSKFRNSFHLKDKEIKLIDEKGMEVIKKHAYDLINKNLAKKDIINDGKQTPTKGHPVFIAQHATATCCRKCLYKWHKIVMDSQLNNQEIDYIVDIITRWIEKDYKKTKK